MNKHHPPRESINLVVQAAHHTNNLINERGTE